MKLDPDLSLSKKHGVPMPGQTTKELIIIN